MSSNEPVGLKFRPQPFHVIGIVGNLGSGKSLLAVVAALFDLEVENKQVFANFKLNYQTPDGRTAKFIDIGRLASWITRHGKQFAPNSALLVIDESYLGLDARNSNSLFNRLMSYFIFQSRKLGFGLIYTAQLASSVEKRLRNLTDVWVLAENKWEQHPETGEMVENFYYTAVTPNNVHYFSIMHDEAMKFFPLYKTTQIIKEPRASIDKTMARKMEEERVSRAMDESGFNLDDAMKGLPQEGQDKQPKSESETGDDDNEGGSES